jgi:hypothetical protein
LLGFARLDTGYRGLITQNATHELEHQWGAYISPTLGLQTGGHYLPQSSVGSLIGGHRWIDNGNGTYTLDCTQGRGGAHMPAYSTSISWDSFRAPWSFPCTLIMSSSSHA